MAILSIKVEALTCDNLLNASLVQVDGDPSRQRKMLPS